jgi:SPP1 gp7 family putative phage head morphogenesis protein
MDIRDLFSNRKVAQLERENLALVQRVASLEARTPAVIVSAAAQYASALTFTPGNRQAKVLRIVADQSPIVRAAINAKKRHVTQLDYAISGDDDTTKADLLQVLKRPYPGGSWRKMVGMVIEDVMVLDASAVYIWPTRGGDLYGLLPIDANTIWPALNDLGILPEPPEIAYEQYIAGTSIAQLTSDELIYLQMNPRTWSLNGLSPVEAVLLAVGVMLKRITSIGDMFDDGNVPAFFGEVPEGWTGDQIKVWQEYWDAMTAGEPHKGIWGPKGANATFPPQQTYDVAFDEWLVQVVCAVMEIQPQELGFTADVNRATGSSQEIIAQRRSVRPLALLIKEGIDHAFKAMGYEGYELAWPTLDARDRDEIRKDAAAFIPTQVAVPNDIRTELGMDPIEGGDVPVKQNAAPTQPPPSATGEGSTSRALHRAKPKVLKTVALDDNAQALKIEQALRAGVGAAFVEQQKMITPMFSGIDVPATLDLTDEIAVDKWATREMSDRMGKRVSRTITQPLTPTLSHEARESLIREARDDDWESLMLPPFLTHLKALGAEGAQAGAQALHAAIAVDWTLANQDVARWARRYSSLLVGNINTTTWAALKDELAEWAMSQETYDQLVQRLTGVLNDAKRADLIASTEATRAYAQGNRIMWQKTQDEYGVTIQRQWLTAADELVCPICGALAGAVADLDGSFAANGAEYDGPPAHPRCRCDVAPVV